jgi:hypothetical protein
VETEIMQTQVGALAVITSRRGEKKQERRREKRREDEKSVTGFHNWATRLPQVTRRLENVSTRMGPRRRCMQNKEASTH